MSDEREKLDVDSVDKKLAPGEYVHTFTQANTTGMVLLGCDIKRSTLLDMAKQYGAELAGETAMQMNHGIVIWDNKQPMFCATE